MRDYPKLQRPPSRQRHPTQSLHLSEPFPGGGGWLNMSGNTRVCGCLCVCVCVYLQYIYTPTASRLESASEGAVAMGGSLICQVTCVFVAVCVFVCVCMHIYMYTPTALRLE